MEFIEEDKLKLLDMYYRVIKNNPNDSSKWKNDAQPFAMWYKKCNETTKNRAQQIYGTDIIKRIVEYADEKNLIDFEKDYKKITDYEKPNESWKFSAWGCANCFDNSSDEIKKKILDKYGKDFVDKVLKYREENNRKNAELFYAKFSKDVADDIVPVMPLLDLETGILFYSKKANKLYVLDTFIPLKISTNPIATKKSIKNNETSLSWEEINNIFSYEHADLTATYYKNNNTLVLSSDHIREILSNVGGIYEQTGEMRTKNFEKIEKLSTKLKDFNAKYFEDRKNEFSKTKEYLKNKLNINCF